MKLSRRYVTPLITLTFLIVALTGVLMFFHIFDGYTEVAHEYLGGFFTICTIFHIILNWKALKIHFKKGVYIPAVAGITIITILLLFQQQANPKVDTILLERIIKAPVGDVFKVLQVDSTEAITSLQANGISTDGALTLEDIWLNNNTAPQKVFDLITDQETF